MINLKPFCAGPHDMRRYLHQPWRVAEGIVATNGHIIICVPDDDGDHPGEPETIKNVVASFTKEYPAGEFVELSSIVMPPKHICKTCKGAGHYTVTDCELCEGQGLIYDDAVGYMDCLKCEGYGFHRSSHGRQEKCDDCDGMGEERCVIPVGIDRYQRKYLAQLQALPNCKFSPVERQGAKFEFDGGFGWLMPVNS